MFKVPIWLHITYKSLNLFYKYLEFKISNFDKMHQVPMCAKL